MKKSIAPAPLSKSDVYAAGFQRIWSINPNQQNVATVWLNGVPTALTDGTYTAAGKSVVVDDDDVYVAGVEYDGSQYVAKLWVNGIANNLSNGVENASANSVFTNNGEVYVGGHDGNNGKIWQLGGPTQTFTPLETNSSVGISSIFIDGSDIYACGNEISGSGINTSHRVWKNGTPLFFSFRKYQ